MAWRKRKPRKLPPVYTWTEEIDAETVAGCAMVSEIRLKRFFDSKVLAYRTERGLYGLSCFVLFPRNYDGGGWGPRSRYAAEHHLRLLAEKRQNRLDFIMPADGIEE